MYTPAQFRETRPDVLLPLMRTIKLAVFVTGSTSPADSTPEAVATGGLHATHAPTVVGEVGGKTVIETHFARPNPHCEALDGSAPTLAIYQGPQAYVSPSYYPSKAEHGKVVPTWTYVAIHAHGRLSRLTDAELAAHLEALTDDNERGRPTPWGLSDAPEGFIPKLSRAIVGVRLTVEHLEASFKLNQNKSEADFVGTMAGLSASTDPSEREVGALMADMGATR